MRWQSRITERDVILVTGAAGFIGHRLSEVLTSAGKQVIGIDNLNDYYDPALKLARLETLKGKNSFTFERVDLADRAAMERVFETYRPRYVVNLGAQAGVRYSLKNPHVYAESNVTGFLNILEGCRHNGVEHLVYASTSSVYGGNTQMPFLESHGAAHPVSLYAATKKANEAMAHSYSHLYGLPATGLRFFTVYGPWGRPDMAYFLFAEAIMEGRPIKVFNHGQMQRDFTYIDDIVEGVARSIVTTATPDPEFDTNNPNPATSWAPHRIYNIGATNPEPLMDMIGTLEQVLGREAQKEFLPMQAGDVVATWASVANLEDATGFTPTTGLHDGLTRFASWYLAYRG